MVIFEGLEFPNNNTRKCLVECREQIAGTYTGLVYCTGLEEGEEILNMLRRVVSGEISKKIPVILKRGCSEFAVAYPEYAQAEQGVTTMEYKEAWKEYEDLVDKGFVVNTSQSETATNNRRTYTIQDAKIMLAWLRYAATIGDLSYRIISDQALPPFQNLKRPTPFNTTEDEKQ